MAGIINDAVAKAAAEKAAAKAQTDAPKPPKKTDAEWAKIMRDRSQSGGLDE